MRALGIVLLLLTGPLVAAPLAQESPRVNAMTWLDLTRIGDRIVAVGERGNVLYSDDDGETWRLGETPGKAMLTAVCFADRSQGWAVGHDAVVWKTEDGGETWQQQYSDPMNAEDDAGAGKAGGAPGSSGSGSMQDLYSDDGAGGSGADAGGQEQSSGGRGGSMQDLYSDDGSDGAGSDGGGQRQSSGAGSGSMEDLYNDSGGNGGMAGGAMAPDTSGAPLLDVWCDTQEHVMAVGGFGYMIETSDGGASWNKRTRDLNNPNGWHLYSLRPIPRSDGTLLVAGEQGTLFRSRDHGQSWEKLQAPYAGSYFGVTAVQRDTVMIHGMRGNVWLTRDLGESWQQVRTGVTRGVNHGAMLNDGSIVLVGNSGVLLTSRDNGASLSLRYTDDRNTLSAVLPLGDQGVLVAGVEGLDRIRELH
jgi:photosystem II stability/assembly factor-like uncharacterized protein